MVVRYGQQRGAKIHVYLAHVNECCVYDLAFKPDGSELLVAADNKVLIYDGSDGTLLQSLKGHKDVVYAVAFSHTGERFASGSADRSVIIWTEQHEGTLKYVHNDAIQCLAFSPVTNLLLSCACTDYGFWTQQEKNVTKQRVNTRILCCAWSTDGNLYALGMYDGSVLLKNYKTSTEVAKIERPSGEPVWALKFGAGRSDAHEKPRRRASVYEDGGYPGEILAVSDWSQNIGFYDLDGNQVINRDKHLGYDPTSMEYFNSGQFLAITGSSKQVLLYTREGTLLGTIAQMDSWVWTVTASPNTNTVVVGCIDGTVACYQLMFSTVHGLHKNRYAYRDNMTDVVVQHLSRQTSVRIRCNDLVRKVAVYHHRLAVQLTDKVHIYREITNEHSNEQLDYRIVDRINQSFDCSLLVICAQHLILCQERRLQCYDYKGLKQREWVLDSMIRYIKVVGGPPGREGILIGLKNGVVCKVYADNPFPVKIMQLKCAIRCLDISHLQQKLAAVDETSTCMTFIGTNNDLLFQEPNSNSVAWNSDNENLLCYAGNGVLNIKAHNFPPYQQRLQGFVVGFTGKTVFCLHMYAMTTIEVPLTNQLYQYLEKKMYREAYELASLGVTESDWKILADDALQNLELETASLAYLRMKDWRMLLLINEIEDMLTKGHSRELVMAYICANQRRFREAAILYQEHGYEQKSLDMFTDLRMFDQAQDLMQNASEETKKALLRKRAEWAKNSNDPRMAAEMLVSSGDYDRALKLMIEHDWMDMILQLMRKMEKSDVDGMRKIGEYLVKKGEYQIAAQLYISINDIKSLIKMHISAGQWDDAFAICARYPQFNDEVYLPYARSLAEKDMFDEAQKAYSKAGHEAEALKVLQQLTENSLTENRFKDAGYYYWKLSMEYAYNARANPNYLNQFEECYKQAECYFAYDSIHKYLAEPFTNRSPEHLINIARFLASQKPYVRISKVGVFYTLAKLGKSVEAYKMARYALEQLSTLKAPPRLEKLIGAATLDIRAKPYSDPDDILPMCYRCGTANPIMTASRCINCNANFVYSFATFEILPLVEFTIADDISDEEAYDLINAEPPLPAQAENFKKGVALVCDRDQLLSMEKSAVLVAKWQPPLRFKYYYNVISEITVTMCECCFKMFHQDDYEIGVLQEGHCPFCRTVPERSGDFNLLDEAELDRL
ncbi:hypothetical protein QR680_003303 [Steinernema hermaphroditum]|uniref:Intraflagellar transport protein 122 homolog n=1 Tax=Steinernema hermaphroditum TaxID=289476 RepID=A0AA39H746_9BILA|nr:hypothetical protein QR680_003303 [Steinernema hermaphroditum]